MTQIIIFKLRIWRTVHSVSMMTKWPPLSLFSNYAFDVHTIWRTHSVSMMTEWPPLSLFSNYAFDVHTVYQWWLNDHRYHYFQTTHLTYTQCINDDWMTTVIIIFKLRIWRTHSVSMMPEWPLSLFSNYVFEVHTVYKYSVSMMTEWPPLSLFSNHAFNVHTVYQWWLNDRRYHYFQTTHLTYTQCIDDDWMNDHRYHYFQTTHLTSLFSNYVFDVHTV